MVQDLSVSELAELLATSDVDLIDVREPFEFASGYIRGARNVPLGELQIDPDEVLTERRPVFVCEHGNRSVVAGGLVEMAGRADVAHLERGMEDWRRRGMPVELPDTAATGE